MVAAGSQPSGTHGCNRIRATLRTRPSRETEGPRDRRWCGVPGHWARLAWKDRYIGLLQALASLTAPGADDAALLGGPELSAGINLVVGPVELPSVLLLRPINLGLFFHRPGVRTLIHSAGALTSATAPLPAPNA
jgi:hypothetical protein